MSQTMNWGDKADVFIKDSPFLPLISYVLGGGALCMELLTKQVRLSCSRTIRESK